MSGMLTPYAEPKAEDDYITTRSDIRWDKLTFEWFGSFDRLQDVKNANPQIALGWQMSAYIPQGTIVYKPIDSPTEVTNIGASSWRKS